MAKLVVNPSSSQKREVSLPRTVLSIGRDPSNDLVLPDAMVSRRHAVVEWRGGQFFIRDCNSSNGSLVNGDRVSERGLRDGDLVAIGTARLLFRDDVVEEHGAKVVQHPSAPRLQCPACNADYRKGDLFCRQCGASVAPPPPQKSVCASCGTAVVLPARFCNACGRVLPGDPSPSLAPHASGSGAAAVAPAAELAPALPSAPAEVAAHAQAAPEVVVTAQEMKAVEPEPVPEPAPGPQASELPLSVTVPPDAAFGVPPPRGVEPLRTAIEPPRTPRPSVPARPARPASARPAAALEAQPSPPASAGARLLAAGLDALMVGALQAVVLGPLAYYWQGRPQATEPGQIAFLPILLSLSAILLALLIGAGYYVWGWGVAGATPGKKLMGLAVETHGGSSPIGPVCALVRLIGYVVSALPLGLGFLMVPFVGEGLHDKLAGTRVVRRKE